MIEELDGFPAGTLGFRMSGKVSRDDYQSLLTPAIDKALQEHDRIRLLMQIGPEFDGYEPGAAWDDMKLGLHHWRGFDRIAVVTDVNWVASMVRAIGFMMPCPVQLFGLAESDDARRWLSESLGSIHLEQDGVVIKVRLLGELEPVAYEGISADIDNLMSKSESVRLMIDLSEFDGWTGISALGDHLSLAREHRHIPERIAIIGDKAWQRYAPRLMGRFMNGEARFFESGDIKQASDWLKGGK